MHAHDRFYGVPVNDIWREVERMYGKTVPSFEIMELLLDVVQCIKAKMPECSVFTATEIEGVDVVVTICRVVDGVFWNLVRERGSDEFSARVRAIAAAMQDGYIPV